VRAILPVIILTVVVSCYVPSLGDAMNCWGNCDITAMGLTPGPHIAACGNAWPAGQLLYVPGRGWVVCGDRGGGLEPTQVDIFCYDLAECVAFGGRFEAQIAAVTP
jgi:3D (Asp-Asp-Asp) domain-containing protein